MQHNKFKGESLFILASVLFIAAPHAGATTFKVTVNTSSLSGATGDLAFDFLDGGPPSNSVTITSFTSNGTLGSKTLTGGASGTLPGTVVLTDSSFFNEYLTGFTFGSSLSFFFTPTNLPPTMGSSPDGFTFYLLDSTGMNSLVTTSDPTGANSLFESDSTGAPPSVYTSTQETTTVSPVVSGVPEPSTFTLIAIAGVFAIAAWLRRAMVMLALAILMNGRPGAFAASFTFTKVIDGNTPRPDGQGNFSNPHDPSTDGRYVIWVENGLSLWSADLNTLTLTKLADTNTPVPSGTGNFTGFGQTAGGPAGGVGDIVRSGTVAFIGQDSMGQGVYSVPATGGTITRVVNYNTPPPNGGSIGLPGQAIFEIGLNDTGTVTISALNSTATDSIYSVSVNGSNFALIADDNHRYINPRQNPGNNNSCVFGFGFPSVGGNNVLYVGSGGLDFWGIYNLPVGGPAQGVPDPTCSTSGPVGPLVVGSTTPLPGDPTPSNPIPAYGFTQTDGTNVYFNASDYNYPCCAGPNGWSGIFSVSLAGGAVARIVEVGDTLPVIGTVTNINGEFSVDNGGVVFLASNGNNAGGIFLYQGGQIYKVFATGDTLNGSTVTTNWVSEIWPQSYKNGKIAFRWTANGGNSGVFVASNCASDVSSQVSVTRGGFLYNRSTGKFVQQVTITNTSGSAINGPMELLLENLSANATLSNANGTSACLMSGSPYINVPLGNGNSLAAGGSVPLVLSFSDPTRAAISYSTAVAAGTGAP